MTDTERVELAVLHTQLMQEIVELTITQQGDATAFILITPHTFIRI